MNKIEIGKLLGLIKIAYPNSYKYLEKLSDKEQKDETDRIMLLWLACLSDIDFKDAQEGLIKFIKNDRSGFAPAIGELRGAIEDNVASRKLESMFRAALLKGYGGQFDRLYTPAAIELNEGRIYNNDEMRVENSTFDVNEAFAMAVKAGMKYKPGG